MIFGATGDLSRRKLLPALYNLAHEGALPGRFHLVGASRSEMSDDDFRKQAIESIQKFSRRTPDPDVLDGLLADVRYVSGSFDDPTLYDKVAATCSAFDDEAGLTLNRCFYLSTAPSFFPVIVEALGEHDLDDHATDADVRVVVEKPIGTNLEEARELNRRMLAVLNEHQIFRIDHYLGKETVQNIMAFRFANGMFEPVWNRNYVDHIQITAAEDIGVGSRAGYYDSSGALRDLVQNHMLQLLAHMCMEPPVRFLADEVRDEKVKVLKAVKIPQPEDVPDMSVRARYTAGTVGGEEVPGYLDEEGVPADSQTETYVALRLEVDNWRWAGRADLPAHRQAPGAQGHRDRGDAQARAAPGLLAGRLARRAAEHARAHAPAQRGRVAAARREDPRHADAHPAGEHGVPVRDDVPVRVARGVRAPDHGRDARRRDAVHARRRGRGAVGDLRPDPRGVGRDRPAAAHRVRGRQRGPARRRPHPRRRLR